MKKHIFLLIFFFTLSISAQGTRSILDINPIVVKNDSTFTCYLSYQISYRNLVFVKNNGGYSAGIQLQFEIYKDDSIIKHESSSADIEIYDYEKTEASDLFLFGYTKFEIDTGSYSIIPIFNINNTQRGGELKDIQISVNNDSNSISYIPLIVEDADNKEADYFIVNHRNNIPYSINPYDMLVRSKNPISEIKLYQKDELIESERVQKNNSFEVVECENRIGIKQSHNQKVYYYLFRDVNKKVKIGEYKIIVYTKNDSVEYTGNVTWFNSPVSLSDPEFAIEVLEIVFPKSEVEELLDYSEEQYAEALNKFWEKYDKNTSTSFNELMYEFYNRVDYAIKKFKSVNKRNGAESEMGKVFIKFGEPDTIKRTYTENYKTVEVWKYEGIKREFVFIDKNGLGNFELVN